ncbi:hypothetical protein HMN09_01319200 [Mycena chlorophos]|uniref:Uncharacterized protein n=1 Tax=Mycena chlorophos TaxID=658473 RepID=A0A8H6S0C9_MYCCL|nr:hypothetical protein HMN09_01319200 [Mycena chlorophos]
MGSLNDFDDNMTIRVYTPTDEEIPLDGMPLAGHSSSRLTTVGGHPTHSHRRSAGATDMARPRVVDNRRRSCSDARPPFPASTADLSASAIEDDDYGVAPPHHRAVHTGTYSSLTNALRVPAPESSPQYGDTLGVPIYVLEGESGSPVNISPYNELGGATVSTGYLATFAGPGDHTSLSIETDTSSMFLHAGGWRGPQSASTTGSPALSSPSSTTSLFFPSPSPVPSPSDEQLIPGFALGPPNTTPGEDRGPGCPPVLLFDLVPETDAADPDPLDALDIELKLLIAGLPQTATDDLLLIAGAGDGEALEHSPSFDIQEDTSAVYGTDNGTVDPAILMSTFWASQPALSVPSPLPPHPEPEHLATQPPAHSGTQRHFLVA